MTVVTLTIQDGCLKIRYDHDGLCIDRELSGGDFDRLEVWSRSYLATLAHNSEPPTLLHIGREMRDWLDGGERWLERMLSASVEPPLLFDFSAAKSDLAARKLFEAPWELLADDQGHWAERDTLAFCPVRRLGLRGNEVVPSPYKLTTVFMAAAPIGARQLRFEDEEAAILNATRDSGMDLIVEESGTLRLLRALVADEKPDVVHISCHGRLTPEPALLLEDELGRSMAATARKLVKELSGHRSRLLFVSACQTAMANDVLSSLVWSLVPCIASAVLGWAGSVRDHEATNFARFLYRRLAEGESLVEAVAHARLEVLSPEPSLALKNNLGQSRDWHLARLYLGPTGGGVLTTGVKGRRHVPHGCAYKAFLNRQKLEVPVAGPLEFVGRRRQLQSILREFSPSNTNRKAGVYLHGLGRQGKSSLAARVADRLEARSYKILVVHGSYDAPRILRTFKEFAGSSDVDALVASHLRAVEESPANLQTALRELLEGPCCQVKRNKAGAGSEHPVLLIIDDFEQALEGREGGGLHRLKSNYVESIRATIKAFDRAITFSRLLFTSRFQFTLPENDRDLADLLLNLPLPPMELYESEKQASAKLKACEDQPPDNVSEAIVRLDRIVETSKGNPGLQDWLFRIAMENPVACDRCLGDMRDYLANGATPDEHEILKFLEIIALKSIHGLLSPAEKDLLRVSTLFQLPVPKLVMEGLACITGLDFQQTNLTRLIALGLWDVYEDTFHKDGRALGINSLVRPMAGSLSEAEQYELAVKCVQPLCEAWNVSDRGHNDSQRQDYELIRLALVASNSGVLISRAAFAVSFLAGAGDFAEAVSVGNECIKRLGQEAPVRLGALVRASALVCRAQSLWENESADALVLYEAALGLFRELGEKVVEAKASLEVARLHTKRGSIEEANRFYLEAITIYQSFGRGLEYSLVNSPF